MKNHADMAPNLRELTEGHRDETENDLRAIQICLCRRKEGALPCGCS